MTSIPILTAIPAGRLPNPADVQSPPTASQTVNLFTYKISSKKSSDPDAAANWGNEGYLYEGIKVVAGTQQQGQIVGGVNFQSAYYANFINNGPGPQVDISHSIIAKVVPNQDESIELIKSKDPLTDWAFDIIVAHYGTQSAAFTGTMVKPDGSKWNLKGTYIGTSQQEVTATVTPSDMHAPASVHGTSLHDLDTMSPIVYDQDGDIKAGQDGAQIRGNAIMNRLIKYSLYGTKAESVIGHLQPITDEDELAVYNANQLYFKRAGVHMLCDIIKTNKGGSVSTSITDHIEWQNTIFTRMCSEPSPPSSNADQKLTRSVWDPALMYGLDPNNNKDDAELLHKLQEQFRHVTMECYALGYKLNVHNGKEALARQSALSANAPGVSSPGDSSLSPSTTRDIVNKLTLLKFAAIKNNNGIKLPDLNIQDVVEKIDAANNENMAYSMYMDEDVADSLNTFLGNTSNDKAISKIPG